MRTRLQIHLHDPHFRRFVADSSTIGRHDKVDPDRGKAVMPSRAAVPAAEGQLRTHPDASTRS